MFHRSPKLLAVHQTIFISQWCPLIGSGLFEYLCYLIIMDSFIIRLRILRFFLNHVYDVEPSVSIAVLHYFVFSAHWFIGNMLLWLITANEYSHSEPRHFPLQNLRFCFISMPFKLLWWCHTILSPSLLLISHWLISNWAQLQTIYHLNI